MDAWSRAKLKETVDVTTVDGLVAVGVQENSEFRMQLEGNGLSGAPQASDVRTQQVLEQYEVRHMLPSGQCLSMDIHLNVYNFSCRKTFTSCEQGYPSWSHH